MMLFRRFYNRFVSPDRYFAERLRELIGFTPKNLDLFKHAFCHRSNQELEYPKIQSNERLEYLGDSILSSIVAEYLFKKYPSKNEGFLTKMRAKIVKRKTLNSVARKMNLDVFLSDHNATDISHSMLGNALEALIGAIYLEKGYVFTHSFIANSLLREYLDVEKIEKWDDNFKSKLLEWAQKNNRHVQYHVLQRFKKNQRDCFKIAVRIDNEQLGEATEFNKKSAEQQASRQALLQLNIVQKDQLIGSPLQNG
jgi:ribonuclease-3